MKNKLENNHVPMWLEWAREIQAIAQTGDHYALNDFQHARYSRLQEIATEIIVEYSKLNTDSITNIFKSQIGYATPKVDVRGAVFSGDKILLVRELVDNRWTMPGGWADVGESPRQSVEREVFEESGLNVKAIKLIGIYDANRSDETPLVILHAYKIVFLCEILGGDISSSNETSEAKFFGFDEIPAELSSKRTELRHIGDSFAAVMDPCYLTVFD
jgi:ADP-ribose pyrophosphatase YjhB (NUDIX family)